MNAVANTGTSGTAATETIQVSAKIPIIPIIAEASLPTSDMELANYISKYQSARLQLADNEFWQEMELIYAALATLALDLIFMLASVAYAVKVFSLYCDLCAQKQNKMSRNLDNS